MHITQVRGWRWSCHEMLTMNHAYLLAHVYLRQMQKTTMGSTVFKITNSVNHGSSNNRIGKDRTSFGGLREDQRSFERTKILQDQSPSDTWIVGKNQPGWKVPFPSGGNFKLFAKLLLLPCLLFALIIIYSRVVIQPTPNPY